jgi:hypothetical protein
MAVTVMPWLGLLLLLLLLLCSDLRIPSGNPASTAECENPRRLTNPNFDPQHPAAFSGVAGLGSLALLAEISGSARSTPLLDAKEAMIGRIGSKPQVVVVVVVEGAC